MDEPRPPVIGFEAGPGPMDGGALAASMATALEAESHVSVRLPLDALDGDLARRLDALAEAHPGRVTLWLEGPPWPDNDRPLNLRGLEHLAHLAWLRLEGGGPIRDAAPLAALRDLQGITIGAERLPRDLLSHIPNAQVRWLALAEYDAKSVDLAALAGFAALRALSLDPFKRGADALGALAGLRELTLTPAKAVDYGVLDGLAGLERLTLMQGTCPSLEGITLPALRALTALEVRKLEAFGDLARFSALERLRLEDQRLVPELNVGAPLPSLAHIELQRCSNLGAIEGLSHLSGLRSLRITRCGIDQKRFDLSDLPPGVTHFRIWRFAGDAQDAHDAAVRAAGYAIEPGYPPEPPHGGPDRMPLAPAGDTP